MNGKELQDGLEELIKEHGDFPLTDEWDSPINAWAFLRAEDSDEGEPCVYFYKTSEEILKASQVLAVYRTTRDGSASNELDPWDEQWITNDQEGDVAIEFSPVDGDEGARIMLVSS